MAKKKPQPLTTEQRIDLLKGLGKGIVEIWKQPIPGYILTSLSILGLGKLKVLPCEAVGVLQGVHTYLALSHEIEEGGTLSFLEKAAAGGTSIAVGDLWANLVHKDGDCFGPPGGDLISKHEKCFKKCEGKIDYQSGEWVHGRECYRKCMGWPSVKEVHKDIRESLQAEQLFKAPGDPFEVHKKPEGWP